jgi:hypothetical protein
MSSRQRPTTIFTNPEIFMGGKAGVLFTPLILNAMNQGSSKLETQSFLSLSTARKFYDTAMVLVRSTLLSHCSIERVQVLLLGPRYLQSASYPDECWNLLGLAVRIAYGLELQLPPPDELDCIAQEVRKRDWYACFGFDQLLSMIYGLPAATSSSTFTTPLPEDLDDDCIQLGRLLSIKTTTIVSFSLQVAKLYRLLESARSLAAPVLLEDLAKLDEEFEAWYSDVPASLRIHDSTEAGNDKSLILALRANMVRIPIHRQSLVTALSALSNNQEEAPGPSDHLKQRVLQKSWQICVSTAEETIRLVGRRHEQTKNAVGSSWFNLYYCKQSSTKTRVSSRDSTDSCQCSMQS